MKNKYVFSRIVREASINDAYASWVESRFDVLLQESDPSKTEELNALKALYDTALSVLS
jgi:hypothetical protein